MYIELAPTQANTVRPTATAFYVVPSPNIEPPKRERSSILTVPSHKFVHL